MRAHEVPEAKGVRKGCPKPRPSHEAWDAGGAPLPTRGPHSPSAQPLPSCLFQRRSHEANDNLTRSSTCTSSCEGEEVNVTPQPSLHPVRRWRENWKGGQNPGWGTGPRLSGLQMGEPPLGELGGGLCQASLQEEVWMRGWREGAEGLARTGWRRGPPFL